ncbi:very large A-kinase anchor protein isoform X2 [Amblyraja radiata]|nr:very large A-kinase anchor protein isoform X2 [Amblyraja radiata]
MAFADSATKLLTDLAKVFQASVDQEHPSSSEKPRTDENVALTSDNASNIMTQPEDGILRKLGSFFNRTPKLQPLAPPESKNGSSRGLSTTNQYGARKSNRKDYPKKKPFHEQVAQVIDNDGKGTDRNTLETSHPPSSSTENKFVRSQRSDLDKLNSVPPKASKIYSSLPGQHMENGGMEEKHNATPRITDSTTYRKLSGSNLMEREESSNKKTSDGKIEHRENNQQMLENGALESANSEIGLGALLPPVTTYSTYHGARRIKRRRSKKRVFIPINAPISEVDEKNAGVLDDEQITNRVQEETNQDSTTVTGHLMPLVDVISFTNHAGEKDRAHPVRFSSNEAGLVIDTNTENDKPAQQASLSAVSRDVAVTGQQKQEMAKVGSGGSTLRTDTINTTKERAFVSDAPQSNATGKSIPADSEEYCTPAGPATVLKLDDAGKRAEKTELVEKGLMQETTENITSAQTKIVCVTEPVGTVHVSSGVDMPQILPSGAGDNYDQQLEDVCRTRTNKHTMVSDTFEMQSSKVGIPADGIQIQSQIKDSGTGISTGKLTTGKKNEIEKPSGESIQTMQRKQEAIIKHADDEQCPEVLEKLMSRNSSTAELMHETKTVERDTSTNTDSKSSMFQMSQRLKTPCAIVSERASGVINSAGINGSEAMSMVEPQTTAEGTNVLMEKSFDIQNPDLLLKTPSEKEHEHPSESLLGNQDSLPEPEVSRGPRLSIPNESVFYRYYQETADALLARENKHSNSEIIADSADKENQFAGEMQDQSKAFDFSQTQDGNNEKAKEPSTIFSPSENNVWYRCFQQSARLSNTGENAQSDMVSEAHLENREAKEIIHSTKPFASATNSATGVFQDTSREYALNDFKTQDEETPKGIKNIDNDKSRLPSSVEAESKESVLKISVKDKEISIQSEAELTSDVCTVDVSHTRPVETNSGDSLKEKAEDTAEKLIYSAMPGTPRPQPSTTDINENVTTEDSLKNPNTIVDVKDTIDDVEVKENKDKLDRRHTFEEMGKEVEEKLHIGGEKKHEGMLQERLEESINNVIHSAAEEDKTMSIETQDKVSEYVPSVQNAAEKDDSVVIDLTEDSTGSLPKLSSDSNLVPRHAIEKITGQEASTGLLKLVASHAPVITESVFKAGEDKANTGQAQTQQPREETELRGELTKPVVGAEDSWPETSPTVTKMENHLSDSVDRELKGKLSEKSSIIEPEGITALLRPDSASLTQSDDTQSNVVADLEIKGSNSKEENNFQSDSVKLGFGMSTLIGDQGKPIHQNITLKKDGTRTASGVKTRPIYPLLDLIQPLNKIGQKIFPEEEPTSKGTEAISPILGEAQLPLPISVSRSEAKSVMDHISSPEAVTPHAQQSHTVFSEEAATVETDSDPATIASLKDAAENADLLKDMYNLIASDTTKALPEKLVKEVQVGEVQEKEVMQPEVKQQSENTTMFIGEGESEGSSLITQGTVSEYIPAVHVDHENGRSMTDGSDGEGFKSAPFLPSNTSFGSTAPHHDVANQKPSTDALGISESELKAGEGLVNDGLAQPQQPVKETELKTELENNEVSAQDTRSETSSTTQSDDPDADPLDQGLAAVVSEQPPIVDPVQNSAVFRSDSAISTPSSDFPGSTMADFEANAEHPLNKTKRKSLSVQLRITQQGRSACQGKSTNLGTKSEDGTRTVSAIKASSNYILPELLHPANEMEHRRIQKMTLTDKEIEANTQILGETQLPLSNSGAAFQGDLAIVSDAQSAVDHMSSPDLVTPHTQYGNTIIAKEDATKETGSDLISRSKAATEDVDLKRDTNNLIVNNEAEDTPLELEKRGQVSGMQGEKKIPSEVQICTMLIDEGENQASSLITQGDISESIHTVLDANDEGGSTAPESQEESFISAPLLSVETNCTATDPNQDQTSQEPSTVLLNPTSAINLPGITELVPNAGNDNMYDGQLQTQQPAEGTEQRTESRSIAVAEEDSWAEISSKMANHYNSVGQESVGKVSEECNIIDTAQSIVWSGTESAISTHSNYFQENIFYDFEESQSNPFADFTFIEGEETQRIPEMLKMFDLEHEHITNTYDGGDNMEYNDEYFDYENEMEQEALILETSLSHSCRRRNFYPFSLPPIYEEPDLEAEATMSISSNTPSPTSEAQHFFNESVPSVLESAVIMQGKYMLQEVEEDDDNPTLSVEDASPDSVGEMGPCLVDVSPDCAGDVTTDSAGDVTTGSAGDVTTGSAGDVTTGSAGDMTTGSAGDTTTGSTGDTTTGSTGDTTTGSAGDTPTGSAGEVTTGSAGEVTTGSAGEVTTDSAGDVTTGSAGDTTTGSAGDTTTGSAGEVTTGSAGEVTTGSAGEVTTDSAGDVTTGSAGDTTTGSAGDTTTGSAGDTTTGSAGDTTTGSAGDTTTDSAEEVTTDSAGEVTTDSAGDTTTDSAGEVTTDSAGDTTTGSAGEVTNGNTGEVSTGAPGQPEELVLLSSSVGDASSGSVEHASPQSVGDEVSASVGDASPHSIGDVSSGHSEQATKRSQAGREDQTLPPQLPAGICVVDSKTSSKPMPSAAAAGSIFYRYFQASKESAAEVKPASSELAAETRTHSQQKPPEDLNVLKYPSVSKCSVKDKTWKTNPRPGKMVIYDQLPFHGNKREVFTDLSDTTSWEFAEGISFNVIRGCWIIYEKPEFQGQLIVLEEGQKELNKLWDNNNVCLDSTPSKIVIGSIKRVVKNHCIPEIEIVHEPHQDANKMYLTNEVACLEESGITPTVSSIAINSGIWLTYNKANFCGPFTLLEADNSPVPVLIEAKSSNIKSLRPLKMGGLKVERPMSPRVVIFEKEMFNGHSEEICKDIPDLKSLWDLDMDNSGGAGSMRVIGGVWVGYEKEHYRGHQYLLEEGEYEDWQAWGGFDHTVQSVRYILADFMKPEIALFEEANLKGDTSIVLNRPVPNLESRGSSTVARSIQVKSGVWVAYHGEHYSGEQYILEKGVYRNHSDWGGPDKPIKSIRPIQLESVGGNEAQFQIQAYHGIGFQGQCVEFVAEMPNLPPLQPNSFNVLRGCWVLYDENDYAGSQYVLEEGLYPDLDSLGCLSGKSIRSFKPIIKDFSIPSIGLFSLDSFEGQELILTEGASSLKKMGYYQYPNSVKVNSGTWILYEHANFRGKQLVLQRTEITNWNKFSGWITIGSLHPLKQPTEFFRIKNKATRTFVTVCGDSEDPRESKLSVCPDNGKTTQVWFYCNGVIKSKANSACIDIIGGHGTAGTKVNVWTEHGHNRQRWNINSNGTITSFLDLNLRLDIKGGDFYDKNNIILNLAEEQQQTQFWGIEMLR